MYVIIIYTLLGHFTSVVVFNVIGIDKISALECCATGVVHFQEENL